MNRFTLSLKITYLVISICGLFSLASLWLYFNSSKEVWSSASLYRVEFVSEFLARQAGLTLETGRGIEQLLTQIRKNQNSTIENAKLAFFSKNLVYIGGINILDDSDRVGVQYEHQSIQNMRDFIRASGPLLNDQKQIVGFYRFEFFNNEFQTKLKDAFTDLVKTTLFSLFFLIVISFLVARNGIARPYEELQMELISRLEKIAEYTSRVAGKQSRILDSLEERNAQLGELEGALDAFILNLSSAQNFTQILVSTEESQTDLHSQVQNDLQRTMTLISSMKDHLSHLNRLVQDLDELGKKNDILTLNTFLEVTRASEDAQGFSVLAAEIRKLNKQCSEIVSQFPEQIDQSMEELQQGSETLKSSSSAIQELSSRNAQTHKNFDKLQLQSAHCKVELENVSKEFGKLSMNIHELHKNLQQLSEDVTGLWKQTEFVYDLAYVLDSYHRKR